MYEVWSSNFEMRLKVEQHQLILGPKPPETNSSDYAIWRFLSALKSSEKIGSDHAVLLRQIVRWHRHNKLFVGPLFEEFQPLLNSSDIQLKGSGNLIAKPFFPDWLVNNGLNNGEAIDKRPEDRRWDESIWAEPYLHSIGGFDRWQSLAQKEAVWKSISAPDGTCTLIAYCQLVREKVCVFRALSKFWHRSNRRLLFQPLHLQSINIKVQKNY